MWSRNTCHRAGEVFTKASYVGADYGKGEYKPFFDVRQRIAFIQYPRSLSEEASFGFDPSFIWSGVKLVNKAITNFGSLV